jgi:hypothetical protein
MYSTGSFPVHDPRIGLVLSNKDTPTTNSECGCFVRVSIHHVRVTTSTSNLNLKSCGHPPSLLTHQWLSGLCPATQIGPRQSSSAANQYRSFLQKFTEVTVPQKKYRPKSSVIIHRRRYRHFLYSILFADTCNC